MSPWLPPEPVKTLAIPNIASTDQSAGNKSPTRKTGKSTSSVPGQPTLTSTKTFTVPTEAVADFKKALEVNQKKLFRSLYNYIFYQVCEYALNITNGDNPVDVINLKDRLPLIKTWVLIKQMIQSPIKNYGLQNTANPRIQDKFSKCLVAIEILERNTLGFFEIKDTTSIKEVCKIV